MSTNTIITAIVRRLSGAGVTAIELRDARQILENQGLDGLRAHFARRGCAITNDELQQLKTLKGA